MNNPEDTSPTTATPTSEREAPPAAGNGADASPPQLADGIELVGRFEDSGFKEAPFIARRSDGQVIQMAPLLYAVADEVDGSRSYEEIAGRVSERVKRELAPDDVKFLADEKLRPLGILKNADGSSPPLKKIDPLLALKLRTAVVPERLVAAITTLFKPLFFGPLVVAVLAGLVALDVWLFFVHGVAQSTRDIIYQPALLLMVFGLVVLSAAFHECGHATACRYGGAKPGVMGVGIYIVWPAFYTDVTDAYRLGKGGRLRTDLGGIYFNMLFSLLTAGAYFLTGFEPLLLVIVLQHMEMLHQLLPFLRLDGYYIVSDLTGVPDMLTRIKPTLRSLIPGRKADPRVTELKPWVRVATSVYVLTLIPALLLMVGLLAISAPRIFATAFDSFGDQIDRLSVAFGDGQVVEILASVVQMASLGLPLAGITYTAVSGFSRLGAATWKRSGERPVLRVALVAAIVATAGALTALWWPNGEYTPIQPGEKGTIGSGIRSLSAVSGGTPGLGGTPTDGAGISNAAEGRSVPEAPGTDEDAAEKLSGEAAEEESVEEGTADELPEESTDPDSETTPLDSSEETTTTTTPTTETTTTPTTTTTTPTTTTTTPTTTTTTTTPTTPTTTPTEPTTP